MSTSSRSRAPLVPALALAALVAAAPAHASYVGLGVGATHFATPIGGIDGQSSGATGKVYGGVMLNPYFSLEAGFTDLGHTSDPTGRLTAHGEYVDVVAWWPVTSGVSLLGSAGVDYLRFKTTNGDDSGNGLHLGLGAQVDLATRLAVRAQVEHWQGRAFDARPTATQLTVGAVLKF